MHVHHAGRGAVLWSRQLGAVLLIFALLLVLVLLRRQGKNCVKIRHRSISDATARSETQTLAPRHGTRAILDVVTCPVECF